MQRDKENLETSQRLISSAIGALVTSVLVTPLDVIKIRLQAQYKPLSSGDCFIYCNGLMDHLCQCINGFKLTSENLPWYKKPGHFNNSFDAVQKILKTEGLTSLWSGLSPTLVMAVPQVVIYYTLNDWLKSISGYTQFQNIPLNMNEKSNYLSKFDLIPPVCGIVARFTAQATIAPLELIRTKMQSKKMSYAEMRNITRTAIKQGGLSVLWRGMGPTMWRDVPYTIILWTIYEYLKKTHLRSFPSEDGDIPLHLTFFFSGCGAFAAGFISHPFDVTKTHRQIELGNAIFQNKKIKSSTWSYLRTLQKNQGYSSLFSGFYPRMLRVVVATSTMITIFESMKSFFVHYNKRRERYLSLILQ